MYLYDIDYPKFDENDAAPETLTDRFRRMDSNQNRQILQQYSDDYLVRPWLYFMVDGDNFKCLGVPGHIERLIEGASIDYKIPEETKRSIEKRYPKLLTVEKGMEWQLLDQVYLTLAGMKFTPYYKALMKFKWKTGLVSFPLFDLREYIQVRDGKLLGQVGYKGQFRWRLLTDRWCRQ